MIFDLTPASNRRRLRAGRATLRPLFAAGLALFLAIAGPPASAPATAADQTSVTLISSMAQPTLSNCTYIDARTEVSRQNGVCGMVGEGACFGAGRTA
jgi:hypothetical protein